jgi:gliding motility-associated-like protein
VGGCHDTADVQIAVIPRPDAHYLQSASRGCAPFTVSFLENAASEVAYVWHFEDGSPISNQSTPTHTFETPGAYPVSLLAIGLGGCTSVFAADPILVSPPPTAAFHSNPPFPVEIAWPQTQVQFFSDASDAATHHWDFGDGFQSNETNPVHAFEGIGNHFVTLRVENADGCSAESVEGPFILVMPDLFIPNVFSPNGDGVNDVFQVQYSGNQPFNLMIFDRWGVQVFEGNNKTLGWDGRDAKGHLVADGVYFYHLKIGERAFAGELTLVR